MRRPLRSVLLIPGVVGLIAVPAGCGGGSTSTESSSAGSTKTASGGADESSSRSGEPSKAAASPLRADHFDSLPSTILLVAGLDPLRSETEAFAGRLAEADDETAVLYYPSLTHGFMSLVQFLPAADQAMREVGALVRERLQSQSAGDGDQKLDGKAGLITGSGSGIGRATDLAMATHGAEETFRLVKAAGGAPRQSSATSPTPAQ
jgi:hypothetical protein